jgi:hypothetical protein
VIERDPVHAWLVVSVERLEVWLDARVEVCDWARDQRPAPNVELKMLYGSATEGLGALDIDSAQA